MQLVGLVFLNVVQQFLVVMKGLEVIKLVIEMVYLIMKLCPSLIHQLRVKVLKHILLALQFLKDYPFLALQQLKMTNSPPVKHVGNLFSELFISCFYLASREVLEEWLFRIIRYLFLSNV